MRDTDAKTAPRIDGSHIVPDRKNTVMVYFSNVLCETALRLRERVGRKENGVR